MNLVIHVLKKDIRRSWVLLSVWLVLLVLQGVLIGASTNPGDQPMQALYQILSQLVPFFEALLIIVIVPHVLQEEPLVGTTAFWLTRPISGSTLLKAKTLFALAVLVLPPLAVQTIVLSANGLTAHDVALAAPEIAMGQLCLIIMVATVAALTPSFGKFAVLGVSLLIAFLVATLALQWLRIYLGAQNFFGQGESISLMKSRSAAASLLTILAGGAVIAHQYLTRGTLRTILAGSVCAAALFCVPTLWPWDFLAPPPLTHGAAPFDVAAAKVELTSRLSAGDIGASRGQGPPQKRIYVGIELAGVSPGYVFQLKHLRGLLTLPDAPPISVKEPMQDYNQMQTNTGSWEAALGGTPVINSPEPSSFHPELFTMDASVYRKYLDEPLTFSADLDFLASKYVLTGELPLVKGSRNRHGSDNVVITDVLRQPDGVDILLREHRANLLFDRANTDNGQFAENMGRVTYLLRNKERNQAVLQREPANFTYAQMTSSILVNRSLRISFGREKNSNRPTPDLTPEWLAGAELVRLDLVPLFDFSKHLVVEKFRLNGQNGFTPSFVRVKADREALSKIALPQNATKEQVTEYINSILIAMRTQNSFDIKSDPQAAMFARVGASNLDALLDARSNLSTGSGPARYIDLAITQLVRPEDKDFILQALPSQHQLADVVLNQGWQVDARYILIAGLSGDERNLPDAWIKAIASLQDPATYAALKAYFLRCNNPVSTFAAIRNLPGIELSDTVDVAWKRAKGEPFPAANMCGIAAEFGHLDALDMAATFLRTSQHAYDRNAGRDVLKKFTPAAGDDAALLAWFDANRGKLAFDAQSKKFVIKP